MLGLLSSNTYIPRNEALSGYLLVSKRIEVRIQTFIYNELMIHSSPGDGSSLFCDKSLLQLASRGILLMRSLFLMNAHHRPHLERGS